MCSYYEADRHETEQAMTAMSGLCSKPEVAKIFLRLVSGEISKEEADRLLAPILLKGEQEKRKEVQAS